MLLLLLPTQVSTYWALIQQAVEVSVPPGTLSEDNEKYLLEKLFTGDCQAWIIPGNLKGDVVKALMVTTVFEDDLTHTKDLLVFALQSFRLISEEDWIEVAGDLDKVAKSWKCDRIVTYSKIGRVIDIMEKAGYDSSYRFLTKEVR